MSAVKVSMPLIRHAPKEACSTMRCDTLPSEKVSMPLIRHAPKEDGITTHWDADRNEWSQCP